MKKFLPLALAICLAAPLAAHAQAPAAELTPEHFAALDRNNSGGISKDEYEQFMREAYRKLDTDGNQSLSPQEAAKVLSAEQFAAVDANNDGQVTLDEFMEHVMRDFARYDTNGDGVLQP